jgi:L-ascorbate metabolism protein UlaG (beta-lactamase superfamily)
MSKQFGAKVTEAEKEAYQRSPQWDGQKFNNLEETIMKVPFKALPKLMFNQLFGRGKLQPKTPIPHVPFDKEAFLKDSDSTKFIWFGHSAILCRMHGKTIFIDPMLGPDAAPIAPFKIKRFNTISLDLIDELPPIDLLIMSHDHYDHLDLKSMERLAPKVNQYFTALGVSRHLESWGVAKDKITEFDWWEAHDFEGIKITFTPTRHFSARGMRDRFHGLWGGWSMKSSNEHIWFSGDGGYGEHFKEIGAKLGPFDMAFMECGQYNKLWRPIHLFPEECIRAAQEANAKKIMPVHWGSFTLSDHPWKEPVEQFIAESEKENAIWFVPQIGAPFALKDTENLQERWWEKYS